MQSARNTDKDIAKEIPRSEHTKCLGLIQYIGLGTAAAALVVSVACVLKVEGLEQSLKQKGTTQQQQVDRLSGIIGHLNDVSPGVASGSSLSSVTSLPGYGERSPKQSKILQQATLQLISRPEGTNQTWSPICTATKVSQGGQDYILTAAHCFKDTKGDFPSGPQDNNDGVPAEAVNIVTQTANEYAVALPAKPGQEPPDTWEPIAMASGIAVDESGVSDWALLQVSQVSSQYVSIASNSLSITDRLPIPGESVTLYSLPASNGNQPVSETGIYLGDYASPADFTGISDELDLVGINPGTPNADACDYGASGSIADIGNNEFTGPLSYRDNMGYGPDDVFIPPDTSNGSETSRLYLEAETGLNLDHFNTICGYSIPEVTEGGINDTIPDLIEVLRSPGQIVYESK
jgi:hypothetical protein